MTTALLVFMGACVLGALLRCWGPPPKPRVLRWRWTCNSEILTVDDGRATGALPPAWPCARAHYFWYTWRAKVDPEETARRAWRARTDARRLLAREGYPTTLGNAYALEGEELTSLVLKAWTIAKADA